MNSSTITAAIEAATKPLFFQCTSDDLHAKLCKKVNNPALQPELFRTLANGIAERQMHYTEFANAFLAATDAYEVAGEGTRSAALYCTRADLILHGIVEQRDLQHILPMLVKRTRYQFPEPKELTELMRNRTKVNMLMEMFCPLLGGYIGGKKLSIVQVAHHVNNATKKVLKDHKPSGGQPVSDTTRRNVINTRVPILFADMLDPEMYTLTKMLKVA